jgi:hypothetical protein
MILKSSTVIYDKTLTIIQALGRLRQEDCEFEVSLGYIERNCLKKT